MTRRRFSVPPVAFCVLGLTVLPLGTVSEAYSQTTGYPSRSPIVAAAGRINPWGAIAEIVKTTLLGIAPAAQAADNDKDKTVGPGCDPAHPAVAYHAASVLGGAVPIDSHQGNRPIPCVVVAGSTTETAMVGISYLDGTLFYAPQSTGVRVPPGIFISRDSGATWNVESPTLQPGTTSGIPWMGVDPQTNRIWFAPTGPVPAGCPSGTKAQVTWSDDEGLTWHSPPGDPADCRQLQGGMNIIEGPAPHGQPQPVGYPHVVYHCGNVQDTAIPLSVHCWRSLDGGQTWSFVQGPNNPPSDCVMPNGVNGKFGGRARAVGSDGTIYMGIECQPAAGGVTLAGPGPLYLASSSDEGNTWQYQFVTNTSYENNFSTISTDLAVDQAGNVYIVWVDQNQNGLLIVGKGSRWGNVLNVAQPGVNFVTRVAVAVKNPGDVAVAYVGTTGGIDGTFNGYIAESNNALGADPTFIGAPVNDPQKPLMSSAYAESAVSASQGRIYALSIIFGPDGMPWAGFHCGNTTNGTTTGVPLASLTCPNGAAAPPAPLALGVVGRLARGHGN